MFAEILVSKPVSLRYKHFSYAVPQEMEESIKEGQLVKIPFRNEMTTGIVIELHTGEIERMDVKSIIRPFGNGLCLLKYHLELMDWISSYYYCPLIKSAKLFLPSLLWEETFKVKKSEYIKLRSVKYTLDFITKESTKYKKQIDFMKILLKNKKISVDEVKKNKILSLVQISRLQKQGLIEIYTEKIITKVEAYLPQNDYRIQKVEKILSKEQRNIVEIITQDKESKPYLLHGITGSGKTEIFLQLCHRLLDEKKSANKKNQINQACVLVPEISLTPQLIEYFYHDFRNKLTVWHSRLTENEKAQEWMRIFTGETKLVIGSRSALFLPYRNLKLIVIDEEHDPSYKQEQSPRYRIHEVALQLRRLTKAKLLLSSATPKIETYFHAKRDDFTLMELKTRIHTHRNSESTSEFSSHNKVAPSTKQTIQLTPLPEVIVVDLREEFKKRNYSIFSDVLMSNLKETVERKKQALLFLNRRGTASAVICRQCGQAVLCTQCDIPMTYHRPFMREDSSLLICHYCNYRTALPQRCKECTSPYIKFIGVGTEKIEQELKKVLPQARIMRIDRDTMSKKYSFQEFYQTFKQGNADIMIGTQMITKGLDLDQMHLVGVILADIGLHIPDFRSSERVFQLLTQVAGRAGRRKEKGIAIIQTYSPDHYSIKNAAQHDYAGFYNQEIENRKELFNPPFSKIIKLSYVASSLEETKSECEKLYNRLIQKNDGAKLAISHAPALIAKLHNKYRYNILIKGDNPDTILKDQDLHEPWKIDVDPEYCV